MEVIEPKSAALGTKAVVSSSLIEHAAHTRIPWAQQLLAYTKYLQQHYSCENTVIDVGATFIFTHHKYQRHLTYTFPLEKL
jgi:hypothetical protein